MPARLEKSAPASPQVVPALPQAVVVPANDSEPEALEPSDVEPPFESPAARETTAFHVYQNASRETQLLVLGAFFLAFLVQVLRSGSAVVGKVSVFGIEISVADRSSLIGFLAFVALVVSARAAWSMYTTRNLWRKCGLFYQEIVRPSDNPLVRLIRAAAIYSCVLLLALTTVHTAYFGIPHMVYFALGTYDPRTQIPQERWDPNITKECPMDPPPAGSRPGPKPRAL